MIAPTDDELDGAVAKVLGVFKHGPGWMRDPEEGVLYRSSIHQDFNALMTVVTKLEEQGWCFYRDGVTWELWEDVEGGTILFGDELFGDGEQAETRALALCIHAAVNQ